MRVPQGQEYNRYIRFYVNRVRPSDTKSGQSEIDYQEVRIEIVATDDETIAVTAKAVRDLLDRYPHGTVEGVTLEGCAFMDCVALPDEPDIADRMRMMLEFHFRVARTRTR
jgi:hypothetical protein